jgi:hypothetical protein
MFITVLLRKLPKHFMALIALLILNICSVLMASAEQAGDWPLPVEVMSDAEPTALFSPLKTQTKADTAIVRDREVVRSRQVDIDLHLLLGSADLHPGVTAPGRVISLNLFADANFVAEADRVDRTSRGVTWVGRLRGIDLSQVIIIVNGDVVAGNISMPSHRYHIRFMGKGIHEVQEIDESLFPPDEPFVPIPLQKPDDGSSLKNQDTLADNGSTIDVMVVYSAATRAAAGGTAAMQTLIDLAVGETNQSYQNSNIVQRLRLVHSEEVAYTETGDLDSALNCITSTSDGCIDNIHALRNAYGADLVSFWVENGGGYCGIAWLMDSVSPSFSSNGFSVVARSCATGYYSFGHELGHNMGARHDVYVDPDTTPYAYAHGYAYPAATSPWRTVMAYNNACSDIGKNCARIQYWSNSSISYGGVAMGNAAADNQQTLDNTAFTVANFRASLTVNYLVTASVTGGHGTVSPGSQNVDHGNPASINITPDAGYHLASITDNGQSATIATPYVISNVTEAHTVVVTFAPSLPSPARCDFNGDGKPDILLRNTATGADLVWFMDGTTRTGTASLPTTAVLAWTIGGVDDFNGDGKPDILWRRYDTGKNAVWFMDGTTCTGTASLLSESDTNWMIAGTGDFNADGKPDILWRNPTTGENRVWFMDGTIRTGTASLPTTAVLSWTIGGVGDFNGDGKPDILWRRTDTGKNAVWFMDGTTCTGTASLATTAVLAWTIGGVGDFNGDGKPDILWRRYDTGKNAVWFMDGTTCTGTATLPTEPDPNWKIVNH